MNVDLIIASSIFIIFVSVSLFYLINLSSQGNPLLKSVELRKQLSDFIAELTSQGMPENWEKEKVLPSSLGLSSGFYSIPILISDSSGINRVNEPISLTLSFDEDCQNIAWNGSVRIYDENFNEVPFRFVNQTFCPSGFLKKAILFFEINVSANSSRKLDVFFSNFTSLKVKDYGNFSNLVLWLTFDEGFGNVTYDYSGNNNNGTLYNGSTVCGGIDNCPLWVDGKFGKAISFDGVDDYVATPVSSLQLDRFTLVFWATGQNGTESYPRFFSLGNGVSLTEHFAYQTDYTGSHYLRYVNTSGSVNYIYGLFSVSPRFASSWTMFTMVVDIPGNSLKAYTNTTLTKNVAFQYPPKPINVSFLAPVGGVKMILDEVRIYNRALSDEEILSHYQQPLQVKVFPLQEVNIISFEKLEFLRNVSYEFLKEALQKGYEFRIEIYEK